MRKKSLSLAIALILALGPVAASPSPAADIKPDGMSNQDWWPNRLDLSPLRGNDTASDPQGANFNYAKAFNSLDFAALKSDIKKTLTTSQPWWPADYGNYGPFFIRMAWHAAGTYRMIDGRGGAEGAQQRFEPLNSWPDNASLDKARRLLLPLKEKYGNKISWGDLMELTGTVALESMGFKIYGFAGGRVDEWEPDMVYWGPEKKFLADERFHGDHKLESPLAAVQMGLIYVNPEGPNGNSDPISAARDTRIAFGRMAMNDEETVALIAGGHTFGKAHGAHKPADCLGAEPAAAPIEAQGFGWKNKCGKGNAEDTITSGLEGAWSASPTHWSMQYLSNLFAFDWVKTKSPAGATQWIPKNADQVQIVPDAHIADKKEAPMMFTTDIALREDPAYAMVAKRFLDHPDEFELAFAKAWFKLTHRDLGPHTRYLGPWVPKEQLIWQDPIPPLNHPVIDAADISGLKRTILASGISVPDLIRTAWASASTFRGTDMRGGANGARIRLIPEKDWAVNEPAELSAILAKLEAIQSRFNAARTANKRQVSLADIIVLGGSAAVEKAAVDAGYPVSVPFTPGRMDTTQALTDVHAFSVLEPKADAFRNYFSADSRLPPAEAMVDKADTLNLSVPEMTVLLGGMRVLGANDGHSSNGVFTTHPGTLTNDFFVNLVDMSTVWTKSAQNAGLYEGRDRASGKLKWTATPVDLVFGSNSELRALSEFYAQNDSKAKFVHDFAKTWIKVMNADRFDLKD
jgi:catalase-peroxidase